VIVAVPPPAVSVVIPLHDKRELVLRATASVLAQGMRDFELIVVDDGSRDGGGELVAGLHDPRVRLIRTDHRGPGAARNRGVRESRAGWVAFLDADDEWRPRFLEATLAAAHASPATILVYTQFQPRDGPPADLWESGPIADYYGARLKQEILATCSSVLVKREALERSGGFREDYRYAEDLELWLRLACAGPFYFVAEALALIEVRQPGRLTQKTGYLERAAGLERLYASFEQLLDAGSIPAPQLDSTRRFMQHQRGRQALHLAMAGELRAALLVLREVPITAHTWRDHLHVWRTVLLRGLRRRAP